MRGMFITFEGGEGSGKTTQSKRLFEKLQQDGHAVLWTREPGGSQGAEEIRNLLVQGEPNRWAPETEALLMCAARHDHWLRRIKPALDDGMIVICDRFFDSTVAYQGYGKDVSLDFLSLIYQYTIGERQPDRTYFFDISVSAGLQRAASRMQNHKIKEDRFEGLGDLFHEKIRNGFLQCIEENSDRFFKLDAHQSIEELHALVFSDVMSCLNDRS